MNEIIIEGLEPKDFDLLEKILKTYLITLESKISYNDLLNLYNKIKQIQDHLK